MQTTITARHCQIDETLRQRAAEVCDRLARHASRPVDCSVVFDVEKLDHTAEIRLHISHGEVFVATGDAGDHRTALDRADERLRRQLERRHGAPERHKPAGTFES
jgi:ribosomal subunit interface protein